jgi:CRISPR/Cas system-associated endonuclease Cas3-HD
LKAYTRVDRQGNLRIPLKNHGSNAVEHFKLIWMYDKARFLWALEMLGVEINEEEGYKILESLIFIHDAGKNWSEWQSALKRGNTSLFPHDVVGALALLSAIGMLDLEGSAYKKGVLEAEAFIKRYAEYADRLFDVCRQNEYFSFSLALIIAMHHYRNLSLLPRWLEENRRSPELANRISDIINRWQEIARSVQEEEVSWAALFCLLSLVVECDWYAASKEETEARYIGQIQN